METLKRTVIKPIIEKSLNASISYSQYLAMVSELVENNSTTGSDKTEALANYTMLNDRRMKRWGKTIKISEIDQSKIRQYSKNITWLVITESWCGDAAHIMPVINKVAELNPKIDYRIVLRDENEDLMNLFLTNGGKSIPKLIMLDKDTNSIIDTFGPRPAPAAHMVNTFKAEHGKLTEAFKEDLQYWYNKDKGQSTIKDLLSLLA